MKITKKTRFSELMKHPEAAEILMQRGLSCFGCPMAMHETLEQGAEAHGINADELIQEINIKIKKGGKTKMAYKKEKEILKDLKCDELEVEDALIHERRDKKMDKAIEEEMFRKGCKRKAHLASK